MNFIGKFFRSVFFPGFALFLLLGFLPLALVYLGYDRHIMEEFREKQQGEFIKLEDYFHYFGNQDSPMGRTRRIITDWFHGNRSTENPIESLTSKMGEIKRKFPGIFEVVYFDEKDQVIAEASDLGEFHSILNKAGKDLKQLLYRNPNPYNSRRHEYFPVLGSIFFPGPENFAGDFGSPVHLGRKRSYFFVPQILEKDIWVIVWISIPDEFEKLSLEMLIDRYQPKLPDCRQVLIAKPLAELEPAFGPAGRYLREANIHLGQSSGKVITLGGYLWGQMFGDQPEKIIVCSPDIAERWYREKIDSFFRNARIGLIILLILSVPLVRLLALLSLRSKLLLLFLYSTLIPLGLLAIAAQGFAYDRLGVLEKRLFQEEFEILQEAKRGPLEEFSLPEEKAHRVFGKKLEEGDSGEEIVRTFFNRVVNCFPPDFICLIDEKGETPFKMSGGYRGILEQAIPVIGSFIGISISEINNSQPAMTESAKSQMIMASLEMMGLSPNQFVTVFDPPDSINFVKFGDSYAGMMAHRVYDRNNLLKFIGLGVWGSKALRQISYRSVTNFQKKVPQVFVISPDTAFDRSKEIPLGTNLCVKGLVVDNSARAIREKHKIKECNWLLTGIPGTPEVGSPLLALASDTQNQLKVAKIGSNLGILAAVLLVVALMIGFITSRDLLEPVNDISHGLEALKARNFRVRIPVQGNDELAQLAAAFNNMVEGMEDLEVGKIIQSTFFPQSSLKGNGWEVFGRSITASRVGGDYFDYFPLPDGRWLIIIGDVSGHGVGAALVVAMAKVLTTHSQNPPEPMKIMSLMNRIFYKTLKKEKMMSCFISVFDPNNGEIIGSNGGQNHPYMVRKDSVVPLTVKGCLLGARSEFPFSEKKFTLEKGDWLCFSTDGLMEAFATDGEMIGFQRFEESLPKLLRENPFETEKAIRAWFSEKTNDRPLDDDMTLIVLQPSK